MSSEDELDSPLNDDVPDQNGAGSDVDENTEVNDEELQDEMDDLFGEEAEGEDDKRQRQLDDEELDSGDDEDRNDRVPQSDDEEEPDTNMLNVLDLAYPRCAAPDPSDGEMYLLKIPHFLEIEPTAFNPKGWEPPTADHHATAPSESFSAYNTAISTLRWRRSPSKPTEFQSNARILRWSDGSLTLQLASDPLTQYEIQPKALAPSQKNPIKPTPLSKHDARGRTNMSTPSDIRGETFTYLAQPFAYPQVLRMTNKLTTSLTVAPAGSTTDDALERLQRSMKAARSGTLADGGSFKPELITEDPVLAQKKAEIAEREKLRAQRKLEAQQTREAVRMNRAMNRAGLRTAGLTIGGLEDEGGAGGRRGVGGAGKPKQRRNRHREDWSEEEDEGEDYEEDDFVAADDDEEEVDAEGESEDDVDARIEAQWKQERLAREQGKDIARAATPKRPAEEEDAGVGGDGSPGATRHKRRRVVEDDDEE